MRAGKLIAAIALCGALSAPAEGDMSGIYQFTVKDIDGKDVSLSQYKGKVLLVVNVASKCGFTGQYAGLEKLYQANRERGLVVLGFPANNFGSQEPGTNEQIKQFCTATYGVSFPMFAKISVKGADMHALYRYLTEPATNPDSPGEIGWNFSKFLIGRDGRVLARFGSRTQPDSAEVTKAIEAALKP